LWSQLLSCCLRCGQEGSRRCTTRIDLRRRCRRGGGDGGAGATSRLPSGRRRPASWGEPRTAAGAGEQGRRGPTTGRTKAALRGPSAEIRARAGASRGGGGRAAACGRQPAAGARVFARSCAALLRVCGQHCVMYAVMKTDGYHRYHICFNISGRIRIQIRIMSIMSDKI